MSGERRKQSRRWRVFGTNGILALAPFLDGGCGARTGLSVPSDGAADIATDSPTDATTSVPRPVAPLSTATVTSSRPTLRWAPGEAPMRTHVEICADRACTVVEQAADVTGASMRPAEPLVRGVHYWRIRSVNGTPFGPTWEFWVGARSAPVDTSWGTTLDVDGDGLADVAVGAPDGSDAGRVYLYRGAATGLERRPSMTLTAPAGATSFGWVVANAGDVNGDGFSDLAVWGGSDVSAPAPVYLYVGSSEGLVTTPLVTLMTPAAGEAVRSIAAGGDFNGDGYADIAVTLLNATNVTRVWVYLGGSEGPASTPDATLTGRPSQAFGVSAAIGDVNGDGFGDLVVGANNRMNDAGHVYLYFGGATGLGARPSQDLTGPNENFGSTVVNAGDVNGDGYSDLAVGAGYDQSGFNGAVYIYSGGPAGTAARPDITLTMDHPQGIGFAFGGDLIGLGDVNGDGYADLFAGPGVSSPSWALGWMYAGGPRGLSTVATSQLAAPDLGEPDAGMPSFGSFSTAGVGDVDGDGFADFVFGTSNAERGATYLFAGSAGGLAATSTVTLMAPGADPNFGVSVATLDSALRLAARPWCARRRM